jgi:hypothetical protein
MKTQEGLPSPPPTCYEHVIEFITDETEDPKKYDPKWKAIDRSNIPRIVSDKMSPMALDNFCNEIDRALEPQLSLTMKERMAMKLLTYFAYLFIAVYFSLGLAGVIEFADRRDIIGRFIEGVVFFTPFSVIVLIMACYYSGEATKIEKSVEAVLASENRKYQGSSAGISFQLKQKEYPSQRQREDVHPPQRNNESDPMPTTYMQYYIMVQDAVDYNPPEIV